MREQPQTRRTVPTADQAVSQANGGFDPTMEVFTESGPTQLTDLSVGDLVYALNPEPRLVKPKPVVAVEQVACSQPLVAIETRRAAIRASPNQPIYYQTKGYPQPRTETARNLTNRIGYKFLTEWHSQSGRRLDTVDITDLTESYEARLWSEDHGSTVRAALPDGCEPVRRNSHTGYYFDAETFKRHQSAIERVGDTIAVCAGLNTRGRPYQFDGDDFLRFLGWFITEGSVHWPETSETALVGIAQQKQDERQSIRALFDRMGIAVSVTDDCFQFGSALYGELLERLCGAISAERHIPWFVWNLPAEQQRLLLDVLLAGDGSDRGTYYTASSDLAHDVMRLGAELGITPRYSQRNGGWQVYLNEANDGFHSGKHVHTHPAIDSLIQLTIADYPAVLLGTDGKFQWVGCSNIA